MTDLFFSNWTIADSVFAQSAGCMFRDNVILSQTLPTLLSRGCLANNAHNEYLRNNFPFMLFFINFHYVRYRYTIGIIYKKFFVYLQWQAMQPPLSIVVSVFKF